MTSRTFSQILRIQYLVLSAQTTVRLARRLKTAFHMYQARMTYCGVGAYRSEHFNICSGWRHPRHVGKKVRASSNRIRFHNFLFSNQDTIQDPKWLYKTTRSATSMEVDIHAVLRNHPRLTKLNFRRKRQLITLVQQKTIRSRQYFILAYQLNKTA